MDLEHIEQPPALVQVLPIGVVPDIERHRVVPRDEIQFVLSGVGLGDNRLHGQSFKKLWFLVGPKALTLVAYLNSNPYYYVYLLVVLIPIQALMPMPTTLNENHSH